MLQIRFGRIKLYCKVTLFFNFEKMIQFVSISFKFCSDGEFLSFKNFLYDLFLTVIDLINPFDIQGLRARVFLIFLFLCGKVLS